MIRKNILPPSTGSKCMPRKKPAETGSKRANTPLRNVRLCPNYMMLKLRRTILFIATYIHTSHYIPWIQS
jgi:hypothetical protein